MLKENIKTFDDDGQLIEGYRVMTGKRELHQVIYFKDKKESDTTIYELGQKDSVMLRYAELIVWQMSAGRHI
ncbi:hypothetical protein [Paraglaciecola arctica]|uniref:Uncharacterized protein n=1 Tax=Paraglaciecola arctica BSs20135 TaxID=493475 RepID=K6YUR5_9ALTE|nr:hypothetical protein [Paraglaciecola arctica]GAC21897.1 hypothetical protein GARC_4962 [Paraglaciecola arctica BSs20135]|tara:strand:+ start:466 stop:681 length:216 start_codon:yes stop_codon:yes gene_type:complete